MCISYVTQLVLFITFSSFQFGYGIGNLNAISDYVISTQNWCGDPKVLNCYAPHLHVLLDLSIFAGAAVGCLLIGGFMRLGRRYVFMRLQIPIIIGCVAQACTSDLRVFICARFFFGVGIGMVCVACPFYISEMSPEDFRAMYVAMHQMMTTIGTVAGIAAGSLVPPLLMDTESRYPYSSYALIGYKIVLGLPALISLSTLAVFALKFREETPQFLIASNRVVEAGQLLRKIHELEDVEAELEQLLREDEDLKKCGEVETTMTMENAWESPKLRAAMVIGILLSILQPLTGINAFIAKSVGLFEAVNWPSARIVSVIMALLHFVISLPTYYLVEHYSRRTLMILGALGQFATLAPAAIVGCFYRDTHQILYSHLTVLAVLGCTVFFAIGGPVMWIYLNEMYPSVFKDSIIMLSAFANWMSTLAIVFFSCLWATEIFFCFTSAVALCSFIILMFFTRETKGLRHSPYSG